MKKINMRYIGLGLLILICLPVIIDKFIIGNDIKSNIDNSDWVSFLGSYLGSIIGVSGVFLVTKMDQKEREAEKKDELFFNNISLYRSISSLMKVSKLTGLKKMMSEFKSNSDWSMVDVFTKKKLETIEDSLCFCDEDMGLFNTVKAFVKNNLFNEFKVNMYSSGNEFSEPIEYEDMPDEILYAITNIIVNSSEIDLIHDNIINICISKDKMIERFEKCL